MKKATGRNQKYNPEKFMGAVTLRQLRYFVAAAEAGKVAKAASMISISPSAVTDAIAELEALSGLSFFERHARGLTLTYEGHRFLSHCRNILSSVKDASYAFDVANNSIDGSCTLALEGTMSGYLLAPLLSRFQKAFPNIFVNLIEANRIDVEKLILDSACDVALIVVSNITRKLPISQVTLIHSTRRLWLSPKHPLLTKDEITLKDVAPEPYIQLTNDGAEDSTARYWKQNKLERNIVFRTTSMEAVRSLIAFGRGVTILSDLLYRPWSLEGERVEVRELASPIPPMDVGLVWRRGSLNANLAATTFVNFCRTEFIRM